MRLILILCCLIFSFTTIAQEEERESQENITDETILDPLDFDPQWDYEMIAKGGDDMNSDRFTLVYDSIEAEKLEIFITDLQGTVLESFWSTSPEETGLFVTFSISKTPLKKGVYYLNVVADGKTREAARLNVE